MRKTLILLVVLHVSIPIFAQNSIEMFLIADSLSSAEKYEEAEKFLLPLSHENPYNGDYQYSLGINYYKKGEFRKSITHFIKAQELGYQYRSNFYLACNYIKLNYQDSAIYYLREHIVTPLNGPPLENVVYDTIFNSLHDSPGFQSLLPPKITDSSNVTDNWITDIGYLSEMLKKTHYDPFFKISEGEWDKAIKQLISDVPSLNNDQILVRIYQFLAMIGDAHTMVVSWMTKNERFPNKRLPINVDIFSDGCHIISATDDYKELLGAKIVKVNNIDFDDVFKSVSTLIPIDNKMWYKTLFNSYFRNINLLYGLGISNSTDSIEIVFSMDNEIKRKTLTSAYKDSIPDMRNYHSTTNIEPPLFLANKEQLYWFQYLENKNILYVQIDGIASLPDNPLEQFCDSIKTVVDKNNISAFVLDIRNNTGGNSELNPIIIKLLMSEKINIRGKLFTVISNTTFSAAQNLASDIENYTETIFIGEPTGSRPNFIGEINPFKLPFSGLVISSSNLYHQHGSYSADTRTWIAPDIFIDFSFYDYKNGIDSVLDAIIEYTIF